LFALTGLYQPSVTAKLLQADDSGLLIDIGANFGYFAALWLLKEPNEVLAIEPIRENYELLRANLEGFKDRARTLMCCVGERSGEVVMSCDPEYPMLARVDPNDENGQRIEMRTLSNILQETGNRIVEVLKCDAEGYDVRILNAAREYFETHQVRVLIFEPATWDANSDPALEDLRQFLAEHGYRDLHIRGEGDLFYSLAG
jgi:FkbM family methyltransferase